MRYFQNITSMQELKHQYRVLALKHHPDINGGDTAVMQEINSEFEVLYDIWSRDINSQGMTARGYVREFYTQYGWKGDNYKQSRTVKEIASLMRDYCKQIHNDYRFSITCNVNYICVLLMEAPVDIYDEGGERPGTIDSIVCYIMHPEEKDKIRFTPAVLEVLKDVYLKLLSYRMDDSDGMIDYFDTNFYYRIGIGKYDRSYRVVPRVKKDSDVEYATEAVTVKKTKRRTVTLNIEMPKKLEIGMHFVLNQYFSGGCNKGYVYCIDTICDDGDGRVCALKMDRALKRTCTAYTRGNRFLMSISNLIKYVEAGAISFVMLEEREEEYEKEIFVKRAKRKTCITPV